VSAPTLRPYQQQAGAAIEAAFLDHGQNRLLVKMPTGTGKTVLFAALLAAFPRLRSWLHRLDDAPRMLVIAHREELLEQARERIQQQNPDLMISIEQGDRYAVPFADVVIASIQTLQARKFSRLKRLLAQSQFRLVIVDEAHHAAAPTYRTALAYLGFLPLEVSSETGDMENPTHDDIEEMKASLVGWDLKAPKDRLLIGVTATPNRSDAIGLECVFQTIAYSYGLKQAIADGWLVPPKPWVIETETELVDAAGRDIRTVAGDFNQKQLAEAVNNERRNHIALAAWNEHAYGIPTIGFTVDVQHAHDAAALFAKAGPKFVALSGETPKEDRRIMIRQLNEHQIDGIMNCMVLTEGTDIPIVGCILHLKPTKSGTLYEQMTGRGLRLYANKRECVVLDLVDLARKHSLQTAPVLYGLPPGLKTDGKDLREVTELLEALQEQYPQFDVEQALAGGGVYSLADLKARASTFDIWTVPDLGAMKAVVSMNWIKSGEDVYRLQYPWADGTEVLTVSRDMLGHFDISCTIRPRGEAGKPIPPSRQRTIASQVSDAEAALRLAESFIQQERRSASRLTDNAAPWRMHPASAKQINYLRTLKVPFKPSITSGEASDLINIAKSRQGR
jgi:ATP-dependent helicase IRC3